MSSNCSSPSPPATSSLKALAPTLAEAPEVREEMEVESTTSATANVRAGTTLDMSAFQFPNTSALQALLSSGLLGSSTPATPKQETPADQPSSSSSSLDLSAIRNTPAFQTLLANGIANGLTTEAANLSLSKLFGAAGLAKAEGTWTSTETDSPKKSRLKVFANGYFMTFDKVSSCQKKHFWRCEYKNTCKARMHTDILADSISDPTLPHDPMESRFKILTFIHEHNHSKPSVDEIKHYGLDPEKVVQDQVYLVRNTADPNQRRKIRKQAAEREAAMKKMEAEKQREEQSQQTVAAIAAARAAVAQASGTSIQPCTSTAAAVSLLQTAGGMSSGPTPSTHSLPILGQLQFLPNGISSFMKTEQHAAPAYVSPNLSATSTSSQPSSLLGFATNSLSNGGPSEPTRNGSVKRRHTASPEEQEAWTQDPLFEPTFEIARKLRKLWKGEPSRYPRNATTPTRHLEFFISRKDGFEEHLYVPIRIEQRDENSMREALQAFTGQKCIGMLLFGISPKISVMLNQPMIINWENNQFFMLDDSNPSRWRLMFVDDKTL